LIDAHAYTLIEAKEIKIESSIGRFVRIRNPYGSNSHK